MSDLNPCFADAVQDNYLTGDVLLGPIDELKLLELMCYPIESHTCSATPPVEGCGDVLQHTRVRSYCQDCSKRPEVKCYIDEWWKCANISCDGRKDDISARGSDYCSECRCCAFGCDAKSLGGDSETGCYCQAHAVLPRFSFTSMCQATDCTADGSFAACGKNKVYGSNFCADHCCKDKSGCEKRRDPCYSRCWECQKNACLKGAAQFRVLGKLYEEEKDSSAKWVDWQARVDEINKFIMPNSAGTAALYDTFPPWKKQKGATPL